MLKAAPEAYISFRPPADDETPPTALHNPKLVTPFEAVTNVRIPAAARLTPLADGGFTSSFRHDAGRRRLRRNTVLGVRRAQD